MTNQTAPTADKQTALLTVKDLTKTFPLDAKHSFNAVAHANLTLRQGESLGIVGESGSGKSTLARMILGLTPVTDGEITFEGKRIDKLTPTGYLPLYQKMQMVFQDPYAAFSPRMQVGTFVEEGMVYQKLATRAEARIKARQWLNRVGLSAELAERLPHELSGGQLQRVVIARALSVHPKLLILDEATSALDVSVQEQILELLHTFKQQMNLTFLFIGHDLAVVSEITDRVVVMLAGHIVEILPSENLHHRAVHPYTKNLLEAVFAIDDRGKKKIPVVPEIEPDTGGGCPFASICPRKQPQCESGMAKLTEIAPNHEVACFNPDMP